MEAAMPRWVAWWPRLAAEVPSLPVRCRAMALVSKVRTYSICLSSGTSALASFTAGGSLPDSLPSGLRYWMYSLSHFAAMVIAILVLGGIGAGQDRACPRGARWRSESGRASGREGRVTEG